MEEKGREEGVERGENEGKGKEGKEGRERGREEKREVKKVKVKAIGLHASSWEPYLSAITGRHLPHGITQCYLPPETSEYTPP